MTSHAAHITVGRSPRQPDVLGWIVHSLRTFFRADPAPEPLPPPRHQPRREDYFEHAALRREMFRL